MKIKTILSQTRRDFTAIFECEHCGAEVTRTGYDDRFFHERVIPFEMKCPKCGESSPDTYRPLATKHPDDMHI